MEAYILFYPIFFFGDISEGETSSPCSEPCHINPLAPAMHVETPARMQDNIEYNRFVHKGQLSKALSLGLGSIPRTIVRCYSFMRDKVLALGEVRR